MIVFVSKDRMTPTFKLLLFIWWACYYGRQKPWRLLQSIFSDEAWSRSPVEVDEGYDSEDVLFLLLFHTKTILGNDDDCDVCLDDDLSVSCDDQMMISWEEEVKEASNDHQMIQDNHFHLKSDAYCEILYGH